MSTLSWPAAYRIETPRLMLRCFDPRDAAGVMTVIERSRGTLAAWLDLPDGEDIEIMAARLLRFRAAFDAGERFHYAAFVAGRDELAGTIAIEPVGGRGVLAGGWIDPALARGGLATEALVATCNLAFDLGGARYVELRIRTDNAPSRELAARAGFHHEATLAGRAWSRGVAYDEMVWTLPRTARAGDVAVHAFDVLGRPMT